jgi:hypothetical protein
MWNTTVSSTPPGTSRTPSQIPGRLSDSDGRGCRGACPTEAPSGPGSEAGARAPEGTPVDRSMVSAMAMPFMSGSSNGECR